jgi:hypothetical protein
MRVIATGGGSLGRYAAGAGREDGGGGGWEGGGVASSRERASENVQQSIEDAERGMQVSSAEVGVAAEEEVGGLEAKRLEWATKYTRDLLSACRGKAEGGGVRGMAASGATYLLLLLLLLLPPPAPPPPLPQYLLQFLVPVC